MTRRRVDTLNTSNIFTEYLTPEQRSLFGTLPQDIVPTEVENTPLTNHPWMLRRAFAFCDGPLFTPTLDSIHALLRALRYPPLPSDTFAPPQPNALRAAVSGCSATGLPRAIALRIVEETYQRSVCPRTHGLNHHQAFSDSVYGELMPLLVSRLSSLARPRHSTLLLDLGRGLGTASSAAEWPLRIRRRADGEACGNGVRVACSDDVARSDVGRVLGRF